MVWSSVTMPASTAIDEAIHATTAGPRISRLRRAIAVQGLGGLVVAVTCFLPAVKGCSSPIVPLVEVVDTFGRGSSMKNWSGATWILMPYLFGLHLLVSAVRRRRAEKVCTVPKDFVTPVLLGIWVASVVGPLVDDFDDWGSVAFWTEPSLIMCVGGALIVCCYIACIAGRREGWPLSVRWCASLLMLVWFGVWIVTNFKATYYGIWLSTAGTIAMLVGVVWEAAIRSILPWRSALWGLVRCKLEMREMDQPYCRRCGYLLIGLTSRRCPECGTAFESGETYLSTGS